MIVTVDTNVIFSALYSKKGASHQILKLIVDEKIQLAITNQVYFEYSEVLSRRKTIEELNMAVLEIEKVLDLLMLLARKYYIFYCVRPNLIDETDNKFIECAFASNSEYLITSNVKHFKEGDFLNFDCQIVTPSDFYKIWRCKI